MPVVKVESFIEALQRERCKTDLRGWDALAYDAVKASPSLKNPPGHRHLSPSMAQDEQGEFTGETEYIYLPNEQGFKQHSVKVTTRRIECMADAVGNACDYDPRTNLRYPVAFSNLCPSCGLIKCSCGKNPDKALAPQLPEVQPDGSVKWVLV